MPQYANSQIKEILENLITKYGFAKELEDLRNKKLSGQILLREYQESIEDLAQKLPLTQIETDQLLDIFEQNIDLLVEAPLIIGNGDIKDLADLKTKGEIYKWDGGMIGRGVFENPFAFSPELLKSSDISTEDKIKLLQYHLNLWVETWGETKNYQALKKFFKIYISGFDGAVLVRSRLMETNNPEEALKILDTVFGN